MRGKIKTNENPSGYFKEEYEEIYKWDFVMRFQAKVKIHSTFFCEKFCPRQHAGLSTMEFIHQRHTLKTSWNRKPP